MDHPKWNKNSANTRNTAHIKCTYPECTANSGEERIVVPLENTKTLFSKLPNTELSRVQALCDKHCTVRFILLLHVLGARARPKARHQYTRHSPNAVSNTQLPESTSSDCYVIPAIKITCVHNV